MLLMFLVRFLFPVMAVGSHALFDAFVAKDLRSAQHEVATAAEEAAKKRGALEMLKPSVIVEQAKATAEKVADALIRISVGFLMQTVPLCMPRFSKCSVAFPQSRMTGHLWSL